jgi:hypothetical protein
MMDACWSENTQAAHGQDARMITAQPGAKVLSRRPAISSRSFGTFDLQESIFLLGIFLTDLIFNEDPRSLLHAKNKIILLIL